MSNIDFRKMRTLLPRGSLIRISVELGVPPRMVSAVFAKGWYPELHGRVATSALNILDEFILDPDTLKRAEGLKLVTAHPVFISPATRQRTGKYVAKKSAWGNNESKDSDNLDKMDWDELAALVKKIKLNVDPDDFGVKAFSSVQGREDQLRYAVFIELHPDAEE